MKPFHFRALVLTASALAAVVGIAVAQETSGGGLLNNLEVRELVSRAEPADNARLAAHFGALADRYAAEAKRHVSMSQSFAGNPSRNLATGMSAHCKSLADLNTQEATAARELAAYHQKLAAGAKATAPRDPAGLRGGVGAPEPNEKELNALAAKASTPSEHRGLQEYFVALARRYTAEANEHATLAKTYRGTRIAQGAAIHDRLATLARESAKEATEAATTHKGLADAPR